jgi:hypothetical protein
VIQRRRLQFSTGWNETIDRGSLKYQQKVKGYFDSEWGVPESWNQVILQGPHLHVANPFYKSPNPTMLHNWDWTPVDLEALPPDAIPVTPLENKRRFIGFSTRLLPRRLVQYGYIGNSSSSGQSWFTHR